MFYEIIDMIHEIRKKKSLNSSAITAKKPALIVNNTTGVITAVTKSADIDKMGTNVIPLPVRPWNEKGALAYKKLHDPDEY